MVFSANYLSQYTQILLDYGNILLSGKKVCQKRKIRMSPFSFLSPSFYLSYSKIIFRREKNKAQGKSIEI